MSADLAAVLGTIVVIAVGFIRYQHVDNAKTRELIDRNRDLIEKKSDRNRDLIDRNRELIYETGRENRDLIEKYHLETAASLGEVRERLARIEGRLEIRPTPPPGDAAAEAA
jgi:hypothetical protein